MQESVIISLPSGELMQGNEKIEKQIVELKARGIKVSIKCKEYERLPIAWKKNNITVMYAKSTLL